MTDGLPKPATPEMTDFLVEIRDAMIRIFGFSVMESEGRIAKQFGSFDLMARDSEDYIFHQETAEDWAKTICYGHDSSWWTVTEESQLEIKPWP